PAYHPAAERNREDVSILCCGRPPGDEPHGREGDRSGCRPTALRLVSLDGRADIPLDRVALWWAGTAGATPGSHRPRSRGATAAWPRARTGPWPATWGARTAPGSTANGSRRGYCVRGTNSRSPTTAISWRASPGAECGRCQAGPERRPPGFG